MFTHTPASHRPIRGVAVAAAVGLLGTGMAIPVSEANSAEIATTATQVTRNCAQTVDGERLRLRLKINFTSAASNDVKSVVVRATDNGESGLFGNRDVNLRSIRVKVMNTARVTKVNRTSSASPFSVGLSPSGSGKNALSISASADWYVGGHRTIPVTCFFIDE